MNINPSVSKKKYTALSAKKTGTFTNQREHL